MDYEILTNELDENTKALVEKMENEINKKDKELRYTVNHTYLDK